MIYKGFISYSHLTDSQYAAALQSALHRFARPFNRLRALRIFRDQTDLSTNPALWPVIQKALAESEFFLLLASPKAAQSYWVKREISHWLHVNQGTADKLLIILTEGEIVWDKTRNDFDWDQTNALPRTIETDGDGSEAVSFGSIFKGEPFYLDQRWAKTTEDLSLRNPQFLNDIATLASTLHGKPKPDMIGEDVNEHRKYRRARTAAMALLLTLAIAAAGFAVYANQKRKEAVAALQLAEQRRLGEEQQRKIAQEKALAEAAANAEAQRQAGIAEERRKEAAEEARIAEERRVEAEHERNVALSRQFAADALAELPNDPARSVQYARDGFLKAETAQAEEALRRSVAASYLRFVIPAKGQINGATYSPDGKLIATWYNSGDAVLWDAHSGLKITELHFHTKVVNDLVFSHDAKVIVTVSDDKTAALWDAATGRLITPLRGHAQAVTQAVFSPDDSMVVTNSTDTLVWDARTGKQIAAVSRFINANSVSFSHDGRFLVTSHGEGQILIWETKNWQLVQSFQGGQRYWQDRAAVAAVFSPDDRLVMAAAVDGAARVWDLKTGVLQRWLAFSDEEAESAKEREQEPEPLPRQHRNDEINIPVPHGLHLASFNHDGTLILTANDSLVRIWDVEKGNKLAELKNHVLLKSASFSHNGKYVLTSGVDNTARVWDAISGKLVTELRGHTEPILNATFTVNDEQVLTVSEDQTARVWDSGLGKLKTILMGHQGEVVKASYSPDGKFVLTVSTDKSVRIWNASTGVEVSRLETNEIQPLNAGFSPDGTRIVTAVLTERDPDDNTPLPIAAAIVWDARTGKKLFDLDGKLEETPFKVIYSPDGRLIAASSDDDTVHVWDARNGKFIARTGDLDDGGAYDLSFSPNSRYLVAVDGIARIWNARTGKKVADLVGHMGIVNSARYSPDGRMVVTTSDDNTARIWEVATRKSKILKGHGGRVVKGIFSPDSKYVLTTSVDGSLRVWDVSSAESIITLREGFDLDPISSFFPSIVVSAQSSLSGIMPGGIDDASFSPDSKFIAVAKQDGIVDLLDISAKKVIAQYQRHAAAVTSSSFSPDGKYLLTSSWDNTALIYECEPCRPPAELRDLAAQRIIPQLNAHAAVPFVKEVLPEDEDERKKPAALEFDPAKIDHSFIKHIVDDVIFDDSDPDEEDRVLPADRPLTEEWGLDDDVLANVFDDLDAKFRIKIPRSGPKRPKTVGDLYKFIESQVRLKKKRPRH